MTAGERAVPSRRAVPLQLYLLGLVVVVVVGGVVALVLDRARTTADALDVAEERVHFVADLAADDVAGTVAQASAVVEEFAANAAVESLLVAGVPAEDCQLSAGAGTRVDVVAADGTVLCSSAPLGAPRVHAGAPWLDVHASGVVVTGPVDDATTGATSVVVASPVTGRGMTAFFQDVDALADGLAPRFGGPLGVAFALRGPEAELVSGNPSGDDDVVATATVDGLGWDVVAGLPRSEVTAAADDRFRQDLVLLVVAFVVVLVATQLLYRGLARPIEHLSTAVRGRRAGGAPVPIPRSGPREVVSLADDFAELSDEVEAELDRRRVAEDAARAAAARYRLLFDRNPQPMWVQDRATGELLEVNDATVEHFGWTRDELLGTRVERLVAADAPRDELREELAGTERLVRSGPWSLVDRDGETVECELTSDVLELPGRAGRLVIADDVTTHLRTQRLLQRAQRMESLGQLAGGIAHDFNNLLAVMLNYAEFASEAVSDAARDEPERWAGTSSDIEHVGTAARRAAALTQQLLDFARGESVAAVAVDLAEVVRGLEPLLRRTLGEHVDLDVTADESPWPVVGERSQLEQVVVNLAVNARDAMPNGGSLSIDVEDVVVDAHHAEGRPGLTPGRYVRLRVSDTGVGMDDAVRDRVFEPFFTTKERGSGTGLGLATVYGIVSRAGGVITVYSELGLGTTFTVLLPAAAAEAPAVESEAPAPTGSTLSATILVVEDDDDLRAVAERILTGAGHRVVTANDGNGALQIAAGHPGGIDLVLTDVVMPGMLGSELTRRLRAADPDLRVLLMSGYAPPVLRSGGTLPAGTPLLDKPFSGPVLVAKVREVLESPPQPM